MRCSPPSDRRSRTATRSRFMPRQAWTVRPLLIIDDDRLVAESIGMLLAPRGYVCHAVDTAEQAMAALRNPPNGTPIPVALIDVHLGGAESGIDLIPRLRRDHPELICVVMTAGIDTQTALAALRRGAYD